MNKNLIITGDQKPIPKLMSELYIILIGLAFGFGAQKLVEGFSLELVFRFIALFVILLIWLHSQLSVANLESYNIVKSWPASLLDHYLDTTSAILLVSASLLLGNPVAFYILVVASYFVDVCVEGLNLLKTRKDKEKHKRDRELSRIWICINIVTIIMLAIIIGLDIKVNKISDLWISLAALIFVVIGNLIDYGLCNDFYFGDKNEIEK